MKIESDEELGLQSIGSKLDGFVITLDVKAIKILRVLV